MPEPEPQLVTAEQARSLHVRLQQDRRSWVSVEIPALDTYCLTVIQQAEQIAKALAVHAPIDGAFDFKHCRVCGTLPYPCQTARALGVAE
jgi:hypothetical protein